MKRRNACLKGKFPDKVDKTENMSSEQDPDDPIIVDLSKSSDQAQRPVKRQRNLLDFGGFTKSGPSARGQSFNLDKKKRTGEVFCSFCGDKFGHQGALKIHMEWRHKEGRKAKGKVLIIQYSIRAS